MTTDARATTAQPPICSTMMQMPLSLNHLLERAGTLFASNEIVSRLPDKSLVRHSYGAFYQRTRQLAQALQNMGLKKGEPCVIEMDLALIHIMPKKHRQ